MDRISRSDLALVLKSAAELQALGSDREEMDLEEAERTAAEVGIEPAEFRAAVRALRASRVGSGLLGPASGQAAEARIARRVDAREAARMLTQAHVALPVTGSIESPADGTWRTLNRSTLLQVTSGEDGTVVAAVVDRRLAKLGLIGGGAWLGTVAGAFVVPTVAIALGGSVEAVALGQAVGALAGAAGGFAAGRAAWIASARRAHARVLAAIERMRGVADPAPANPADRSTPMRGDD